MQKVSTYDTMIEIEWNSDTEEMLMRGCSDFYFTAYEVDLWIEALRKVGEASVTQLENLKVGLTVFDGELLLIRGASINGFPHTLLFAIDRNDDGEEFTFCCTQGEMLDIANALCEEYNAVEEAVEEQDIKDACGCEICVGTY